MKPILYVFSGLPGSGKSTLASLLAQKLSCTYLRIDVIEQGLRDLCSFDVKGEGYRLAYRIAADNLRLGLDVIADCCNPWNLTRKEWENVAKKEQVSCINIEVSCSDVIEHRRRVEGRTTDIEGLKLPSWAEILSRDYQPWENRTVVHVDTAGLTIEESFDLLLFKLQK